MTEEISQPQWLPIAEDRFVLEVPDTAILADYISRQTMLGHITPALGYAKENDKAIFISLGYHQEGCSEIDTLFSNEQRSFVGKIGVMIDDIKRRAENEEVPYSFIQVSKVKELVPR
jgi:hypothetical protein